MKSGQVPMRSGFAVQNGELHSALAATQQNPSPAVPPPLPQNPQAPQTPPPAKPALILVVLDPAHGGPDAGAHGASGVSEAEVVLDLARAVHAQLEIQGWHVLQTRQGNENPTFDERSARVNALRGAVFITLHVSSTGPGGAIRAYFLPAPGDTAGASSLPAPGAAESRGLIPWDRAQERYSDLSRRLAELMQVQFAQRFKGSPELPLRAAVRQLRTIAAPAIAVEISSVSALDKTKIEQMAPSLAEALGRALAAFRVVYEAGAH